MPSPMTDDELNALLDELVNEARDIERYDSWDRHVRAKRDSIEAVDRARERLLSALRDARRDSARVDLVEAYLDDLKFVPRLSHTKPTVRLSWFVGDGSEYLTTAGSTFREAIDSADAVLNPPRVSTPSPAPETPA